MKAAREYVYALNFVGIDLNSIRIFILFLVVSCFLFRYLQCAGTPKLPCNTVTG